MQDKIGLGVKTMEFNATFNNISIYIVVEETGQPRENQQPAARHSQTSSHNVV
jgi:hypothetical protein